MAALVTRAQERPLQDPRLAPPPGRPRGPLLGRRGGREVYLFERLPPPPGAVFGDAVADEFSGGAVGPKARVSAENQDRGPALSNTTLSQPARDPGTKPVGRAAKGAAVAEILLQLDAVLQAGRTCFIAFTVLWRRVLDTTDDDRDVARHQAALVHRLRRVLGRRHVSNAFVFAALEKTAKQGLHGHVVAECPKAFQRQVLDVVEAGLARRYRKRDGKRVVQRRQSVSKTIRDLLPPRTFNRDGWHKGSVVSAKAAIGAVSYRLKSLPVASVEHGIRRGCGLRPVEGVTVRCSTGRLKPAAQP